MSISSFLKRFPHFRIPRLAVVMLGVVLALGCIVPLYRWSTYEKVNIYSASKQGDLNTAKALIKDNPDLVSDTDKYYKTALHYAAIAGHTDMAELLLAHRAAINAKDHLGATPLHLAALNVNKEMAELLLAHGADVNVKDNNGWTPLQLAAANDHKDTAELLLAHGADVNAKNENGWTPLKAASYHGHTEIEELLRQHGGHE
jgi:ankyrin repeat protein